MSFESFVAYRYLTGRRKGLLTFITTGIAIFGVALGVAALIITLAVMNGFHTEIQKRILGMQSHIVIGSYSGRIENFTELCNKVESLDEVVASAPFVYAQAILRSEEGGDSTGAVIKGILYDREKKVANLDEYLYCGSWKNVAHLDAKKNWIVLGKGLSRTLNVTVGDKLFLVSLSGSQSSDLELTPFFTPIPKIETLNVSGFFDSGMYEYDTNLAYVSLESSQRFFNLGNTVTGISVKVKNPNKTKVIAEKIRAQIGPKYFVQTWQEMNKSLFAALKLEKIMMFIVLTLIIIVAAFNIISNLLLFTVEKVRDIGILSALGVTRKKIQQIFLYEGLLIGILGIFSGTAIGVIISILTDKYKLIRLPPDVYYLDRLPLRLAPFDIVLVLIAAFIIVLVSTIFPARKAASTDPLEAIRYG